MPSLFRIDGNVLAADGDKPESVVELPGFEELIEHNGTEPVELSKTEQEDLPEGELDEAAKKQLALKKLEEKVEAAKKQADDILEQARMKAQQLEEDAQKKGYEDGYAQASASVREEQVKESQLVESVVLSLGRAREEIFDQIEQSVKDFALFIAEQIIKMKLDEGDEAFLNIVRDTLSKVRYQHDIIVNVSKAEYERLFADQDSEIVKELKNSGVEVRQNLTLKSGECVVETEFGTINASIKTQLSRLSRALEEGSTG
ncbi:MAG TPA: hypothetical protein DEB31_05935 [Clostridiales bacterium]|nr:hypothetical protein [Clostridiales bacterium]